MVTGPTGNKGFMSHLTLASLSAEWGSSADGQRMFSGWVQRIVFPADV
jgi:hypothetical protein